jgi:CheY-like chemotaxis protein
MTILYADDDKEDQEVFAEIIQFINPEIKLVSAEDGLKTLELLSNGETPDIIFLDVNMPFLSGYQALAEIRKNHKLEKTKVVIYSTNPYQSTFDEYAPLNAEYLRKPSTISEGVEALRSIIQSPVNNTSVS